MSDSKVVKLTLSNYQIEYLSVNCKGRSLPKQVISFVNRSDTPPPILDSSPTHGYPVRLPVDVILELCAKGDNASDGLLNMMCVIRDSPSKRINRNVEVTKTQYEMLEMLGSGDIKTGLEIMLGA